MWQIPVLAAAFAAVTRSRVEATSDYFHFNSLKALTDMFVDCDIIIVSEGGLLHNIHQVSQPLRVYNKWEEFQKLRNITEYRYEDYYMHWARILRTELKGQRCKAQILIFYRSLILDTANNVQDLSWFRPTESAYRYTVVIHMTDYEIKTAVFVWNRSSDSVRLPHFYHVTMACQDEHGPTHRNTGEGSLVRRHYKGWTKCYLSSFKTACLYCNKDAVVEHPCTLDHPKECPIAIAKDGQKYGSIASNERQLAVAHRHAYILVVSKVLELGFADVVLSRINSSRWVKYREFIKSIQQEFGQHAVLTRKDLVIFPEEIFFDFVLAHHENMTVRPWMYKDLMVAHELILGPGFTMAIKYLFHNVPVGAVSYSFMTCSNISFVARTGLFSAPFDGTTWISALASVVAVSVALLMALKKQNVGAALFLLLYTMVRLLLENHSDVSRDLVRRGKLMASLTFLMALATIVLSNAYRGVLTSDLSMAPVPVTGTTFEQVLESNWSVSWHTPSIVKQEKMPIMIQNLVILNMLTFFQYWANETAKFLPKFNTLTEAGKREYRLASMADVKLKKARKKLEKGPKRNMYYDLVSGEDNLCSCNGSYWLIETGTFGHPDIPGGCEMLSADEKFFVSEERIGKRIVSWTTASMRPGPVFTSINWGVEGGLYHWLRNIRSNSNTRGVYVKDNFLMRMLRNEPKPLTTETLIVSSVLRLHVVLSLLTIAVLVCEILWNGKKRLYIAVRGWMTRLKCWWLRRVATIRSGSWFRMKLCDY